MIPSTSPRVDERPAREAGIRRRVGLDVALGLGPRQVRIGPPTELTTPREALDPSPRPGPPTASASWPILGSSSAGAAASTFSPSTDRTARSDEGSLPTNWAEPAPVGRHYREVLLALQHVACGEHRVPGVDHAARRAAPAAVHPHYRLADFLDRVGHPVRQRGEKVRILLHVLHAALLYGDLFLRLLYPRWERGHARSASFPRKKG